LPAFSLHDLDHRAVGVERWRGRPLMINFWATWCAPCRQEIPLLQTIAKEQAGKGTQIIGIAVDYPEKVREFAKQLGMTYPLLVGEQDALDLATHLGVPTPAFPFTVFTDHRGAIVALYMGELKRADVDPIMQTVARLDHDQINLATAQNEIATRLAANREK
jgi:thiol-disulfide isomerase/thioredoxin